MIGPGLHGFQWMPRALEEQGQVLGVGSGRIGTQPGVPAGTGAKPPGVPGPSSRKEAVYACLDELTPGFLVVWVAAGGSGAWGLRVHELRVTGVSVVSQVSVESLELITLGNSLLLRVLRLETDCH